MDGVQLCQEMRRFACKCLRIEIPKMACRLQIVEQLVCLSLDILGKAQWIAALRYPDGANVSRPVIDVLKQMVMDSFVVLKVHRSVRQRLFRTRARNFGLERLKLG